MAVDLQAAPRITSPTRRLRSLVAVGASVGVLAVAACGDRAPPALWPEPPPPTLAKPIGIEDPYQLAATDDGAAEAEAAAKAEAEAAEAARAAAKAKLPRVEPDTGSSGSTGASSGDESESTGAPD